MVAEFRVEWKKLKVKQRTNTYDRRKISKPEIRTQVMNLVKERKKILIANIDKRK